MLVGGCFFASSCTEIVSLRGIEAESRKKATDAWLKETNLKVITSSWNWWLSSYGDDEETHYFLLNPINAITVDAPFGSSFITVTYISPTDAVIETSFPLYLEPEDAVFDVMSSQTTFKIHQGETILLTTHPYEDMGWKYSIEFRANAS